MSFSRRYNHLQGPLGDLCTSLDLLDAGFLGYLTRLTAHRRQIALCVLAHAGETALVRHRTEGLAYMDAVAALLPVAKDVRRMRARELLMKHVGPFRDGLVGALGKIGPRVQPQAFYRELSGIFAVPDPNAVQARVGMLVRHLRRLDAERLSIISVLAAEPVYLTPRWIERLGTAEQACDLVKATQLLRDQVFERFEAEAFAMSARAASAPVATFFTAWFARGDRQITPPVALPAVYEALSTTGHMHRVGARLNLCLGALDLCAQVLAGRKFYWRHREHDVIVEAEMMGGGKGRVAVPFLVGLHGAGNQRVRSSIRHVIEDDLGRAGLPALHAVAPASPWDVLFRMHDIDLSLGRREMSDGDDDGRVQTAEEVIAELKLAGAPISIRTWRS